MIIDSIQGFHLCVTPVHLLVMNVACLLLRRLGRTFPIEAAQEFFPQHNRAYKIWDFPDESRPLMHGRPSTRYCRWICSLEPVLTVILTQPIRALRCYSEHKVSDFILTIILFTKTPYTTRGTWYRGKSLALYSQVRIPLLST